MRSPNVPSVQEPNPPPDPEDCRRPCRTRLTFDLPTVEAEQVQQLIAAERSKAPEAERSDGEILAELLRSAAYAAEPASAERYQMVLEHCRGG